MEQSFTNNTDCHDIIQLFWNFMKTMKFLKIFENFIILNFFEIVWNFESFEILWKFWIFFCFFQFWTLISKKQFLCNKKTYCTLVPCNFIHWFCTRVQYDYLLHRNCFLLINMLENGMSRVLLLANRKTVK